MNVIIIGNGVTGVTAARAIRERDPDCRIEIYGRESYHYYYRPRLPEVVAGELEIDDIVAYGPAWYESRGIEVHLGATVASIDPERSEIVLEDGRRRGCDHLLIASGSDPFIPPVEGADRPGVFALRTAGDALAIRDSARGCARAVVIGGGLLGLETAKGLTTAGLEVEVLEALPWLLPRQLDRAGARVLQAEVESLGMKVRVDVATTSIEGSGRPTGVVLKDGTRIPADMVVFSTGVRSTTKFLADSGLAIERGVIVDCDMKTNIPCVYAAGDVAEYEGTVWGIIPVAFAQAAAAAGTITGDESEKTCGIVPSNTLTITGIDVFSVGTFICEDDECREIIEEDFGRGLYRKIVVRDGRPIGAIVIGSRKGVLELQTMIDQGVSIERWGDDIVREDFAYKEALEATA